MVNYDEIMEIFKNLGSSIKNMKIFKGKHNNQRPLDVIELVKKEVLRLSQYNSIYDRKKINPDVSYI